MSAALFAVVFSLLLDHLMPAAQGLRQHTALGQWLGDRGASLGARETASRWSFLLPLVLPLAGIAVLQWFAREWLLGLPAFLLALAVLFFCWGPRDLDLDVEAVASAGDEETRANALKQLCADDDLRCEGTSLVHAVFRQALSRWFGVLFWFLVLGPFGALAYRLIVIYHHHRQGLGEVQQTLLSQWRAALDWPAAQLMVLALALVAHFDAVVSAWRDWHTARGEGWWVLDLGFLDAAARASVREDLVEAAEEGELQDLAPALRELRDAMSLVWRVLLAWLCVLALFVLAGFVN